MTRSHWIVKDGKLAVVAVGISPDKSYEGALKDVVGDKAEEDKGDDEPKEEAKEEPKEDSKEESKEDSKPVEDTTEAKEEA